MNRDALYWLAQDDGQSDPLVRANRAREIATTLALDRKLQKVPSDMRLRHAHLLIVSSCTVAHLVPMIRVAAAARGLDLDIEVGEYGVWRQEVMERPGAFDFVLFAFDASIVPPAPLTSDATTLLSLAQEIAALWRVAATRFGARVLQQSILNRHPPLFGGYESAVPGSPHSRVVEFNRLLRAEIKDELWLDLAGRDHWHDPRRWAQAKFDIDTAFGPLYGDLVARLIAAASGLSKKCLVLDLDNTLWGGVVGDDGVEGLRLGQGDAIGETFVLFQQYVKLLGERGIVLAVCSKNDQAVALAGFDHPEMVLKRGDIATFVANWNDKAHNVRAIAEALDLGLDSLVFVDDNPAERAIVRREVPQVAVPELPEDPALWPRCLADAGYFEAITFTADDAKRGVQYQQRAEIRAAMTSASDLHGFLKSLEMQMMAARFQPADVPRVAQLINKSNQFNLTTRRYSEAEVKAMLGSSQIIPLQFRLRDRYGDHGLISVVILQRHPEWLEIDTWLMSCRVLKRGVEQAICNVVMEQARVGGYGWVEGVYRPTAKNGMVRDHFENLGFCRAPGRFAEGSDATRWASEVHTYKPFATYIETVIL